MEEDYDGSLPLRQHLWDQKVCSNAVITNCFIVALHDIKASELAGLGTRSHSHLHCSD